MKKILMALFSFLTFASCLIAGGVLLSGDQNEGGDFRLFAKYPQ